jgi:DNA-binding protein H-NS
MSEAAMSALFDGFEIARRKHEEEVAQRRLKEEAADQQLRELVNLLDQDAKFMQQYGITHDIVHRTLRVSHNRSPAVTVHYQPEEGKFQVTLMDNGAQASLATAEECAKAIGEMLFSLIRPK